jgi:hypothetical protein
MVRHASRRASRRASRLASGAGALLVAIGLGGACGDEDTTFGPSDAGADGFPGDAADHTKIPYDGSPAARGPRTPVKSEVVSRRVDVRGLMFAATEMQISGEPFAESFAGRNLSNYDRGALPTDQYILDNGGTNPQPTTDLFGYSTAVESYEYSKYHMNMVAFESTAGLSLANGPLVAKLPQATPLLRLRARMEQIIGAAGSDVGGIATIPAPANNDQNYLGFNGLWPSFAPFTGFDPAMEPHDQVVRSCTFSGGYGGIPTVGQMTPEYECAYNTLHLLDRSAQVDRVLSPGAFGLATWKEAIWSIDFVGRIHDGQDNFVDEVNESDKPMIGLSNNSVTGTVPASSWPGTYIGSTPFEGMWGLTMITEMDNLAEWLVTSLLTRNGTTLGGFPTKASALAYEATSPLAWFPAAIAVTEDQSDPFPALTGLAITDATSRADDLGALLLGHAMFFAMTDARNESIGQRVGLEVTFDGDPFPKDDGVANGQDTPHDRALAVMKIAFVDLERVHADPTLGVLVDKASINAAGTVVTRAPEATVTSIAHVLIGLRQTLLSLNGAITQYGAADPDPSADAGGILGPSVSARVRAMFVKNATFVRDVLTQPDGSVANGATIAGGKATVDTARTTIESQAAAVRALTEAFLVTGDASFRDRAQAVSRRLQLAFYSAPARMYRGVLGGTDEITMTPERFGWLQSALRETYKVLHVPGDPELGRDVLEDRLARVNKLFLNGWDDLDGDEKVDTARECLAGRLQLAEQSLTGELGRDDDGKSTADRDGDCVPEVDDAKVGSVMAREVHFHAP